MHTHIPTQRHLQMRQKRTLRTNLEDLKVVLLRELLHCAAGEGAERLLHDEYGVQDLRLLHLLDVAPDRLHAGLGLVGEEDVDLQSDRARAQTAPGRRNGTEQNRTGQGTDLVDGLGTLLAVDHEFVAAGGIVEAGDELGLGEVDICGRHWVPAVVQHLHHRAPDAEQPARLLFCRRHRLLVCDTRAGAVPLLPLCGRQRRLPAPFRHREEGPHRRARRPLRGVNDERERLRATAAIARAAAPVRRRVHAPTAPPTHGSARAWLGRGSKPFRSSPARVDCGEYWMVLSEVGGLISARRAPCGLTGSAAAAAAAAGERQIKQPRTNTRQRVRGGGGEK
jgi:hypothetical protein